MRLALLLFAGVVTCVAALVDKAVLSKGWKVCKDDDESTCREARVPGHAVLDFSDKDPYVDFAELDLATFSLSNYTYVWEGKLPQFPTGWKAQLRIDQIDTFAVIRCNGEVLSTKDQISKTSNAFIPYFFVLPEQCLRAATVTIRISFTSALKEANQMAKGAYGDKNYPHTINYHVWSEPTHRNLIRKPSSDFGWDWGPSFPGPGILSEVILEYGKPGAVIMDENRLTLEQEFRENCVRVSVILNIRRLPGTSWDREVIAGYVGTSPLQFKTLNPHQTQITFVFFIENPCLWYPIGSKHFRDPPCLYNMTFTTMNEIPWRRSVARKEIGIRSVRAQVRNRLFHFYINDELVDWRGFNVIPFDAFSARVNWSTVASKISRWASQLKINALRIWGGGTLPSYMLYEACDRSGILVWQDLPYACAVYPANEEFLSTAYEETTILVSRLHTHPSIVVWGGNNEVEASFEWFKETRGFRRSQYRADYERLFLGPVRHAVEGIAGMNAIYLDSSPSNGLNNHGKKLWGDANDPRYGDVHFYNYTMNCEDSAYPDALFVSEHGVQSLPSLLSSFTTAGTRSAVLDQRQRHEFGFEQMDAQAHNVFGRALIGKLSGLKYESRTIVSQLMQGRCLSKAVSTWRGSERNHGVLLWQLNDVWPGVSWSILEYDLSFKASAYLIRRAFGPVRLVFKRNEQNEVSVMLQTYGEFCNTRIWGYLKIVGFNWTQVSIAADSHYVSFSFDCNTKNTEVLKIPNGFLGWRAIGTAFVKGMNGSSRISLDDWIEPEDRFNFLLGTATCAQMRVPSVSSFRACEITINGSDLVEPYVWLNSSDTKCMFSDNFFLLFPEELRSISLLCEDDDDRANRCQNVLRETRISTLRSALCDFDIEA